ncbi:ABC transporter substrate-binding protein [Azospirillum picis]|uniref:Branched-chain amino acid transport system substrate-binding protein n=1 Tax=Azospirillum picis TaxID=488438 RepID=A0ABU0MK94_9PROT|nr:ABC transporter substrate-binding protein [Azospirillum picis]MBP2300273.1 branched-chain amino acid transport system substrate-binding protein [Azospirillum picis]MDQ0533885.1 branched-chain amino acid transport system substrate-binding protein [Azospirillum picis]
MRKSLLSTIAATVTAAIAVSGALMGPAAAAEPIKVGAIVSATGPASFLGDPEKKVLELYADRINKAGGVDGRPVQLTVYDDGGAADKAASFTKRLIESDGVDVIVGGTTTAATMAAVPLVERAGVPFISLAGAVVIVEPVKKWVFKTPHTDRMAAEKVMEDMKARGLTKLALLSEDSGFGKSGREQTVAVAKERGIELVADETYGAKDTDVTAQLTKIKNNAAAQAVLVFGLGQGPAVVTKNYRQLGIALPLYQSHGVASKEYIRLAGGAAEGVRLPAAGLVVAAQLPESDPQKTVVTDFTKTYEDAFKSEVSTFAGHAYDGLMIALDAVKRSGGTDKAKLRDAIEQTKGYVGTGGTVTMGPKDHMGLTLDAFHMVEVKQGDWSLVK